MTGLLNVDRETAERDYSSWHGAYNGMLDYLQSLFDCGGACGVWIHEGIYVSALRLEPYRDGFLIAGLETVPQMRNRGFAEQLLRSVCQQLREQGGAVLYSHVHISNAASLRVHVKCGFSGYLDHAVFLDGSVDTRTVTLQIIL